MTPRASAPDVSARDGSGNPARMEIPGFGTFADPDDLGWHVGEQEVTVPGLRGARGRFVLVGLDDDASVAPPALLDAMRAFLAMGSGTADEAAPHVHAYYRDMLDLDMGWDAYVPGDVPVDRIWDHVRVGDEFMVAFERLPGGGEDAFVSIESGCDWEPEHGLMLSFRGGDRLARVGPYDGGVVNADPAVVYAGLA
ncbi:hypothetical protein RDV89_05750 [Nocardioides zeae]|uniref:DUF6985 domain-containing protein n=1 Tax=Nocardioides imazamoxiresistens TaxID=3231893 RepID=A0ABU3PTM3_9ACTN|nr:hypothetical protein [Nocardioides zeae]MDT9592558.1 hypothetical protein [Nocardioides zeae]